MGGKKKTNSKTLPTINEEDNNDIIEKGDRLVASVSFDNSKQYLGKEYNEEQLGEMDSNYLYIIRYLLLKYRLIFHES